MAPLGEVDSAEALGQVLAEFGTTHGTSISAVLLQFGPSTIGPIAPAITVSGEQVEVSGRTCLASLKHEHLVREGQGIRLTCNDDIDLAGEQPFLVSELPAAELAAALAAVQQEIPRDEIRRVVVRKDGQGIHLVVTARGTQGTWNLDGSRR